MEVNFLKEFGVKKIVRNRVRPTHRWTEAETHRMLQGVADYLRIEPNATFERPTARRFYDKLREKYFTEEGDFHWIVLKSKMRHLRVSYIKAKEWKENVGTELYASDQKYVNAKIKKMCPFYNLLEEIYGASLNSDPIGFRVLDDDDDEKTTDFINKSNKRISDEQDNSEELVTPKVEANYNEHYIVNEHGGDDDDTLDTSNNNYANYENKKQNTPETKKTVSAISLEEKRFQLDKQKFQVYYEFEARRLSLEERKFKYEKEKFEKTNELRKYEITKQFEIKKLEIETNQRLKLLELGKTFNDLNQVMNENEKKTTTENFEVEVMIDDLETEDMTM